MSERCPHCSFQPTSMSDFCDKHRPLSAPSEDAPQLRPAFSHSPIELSEEMADRVMEVLATPHIREQFAIAMRLKLDDGRFVVRRDQEIATLRAALARVEQLAETRQQLLNEMTERREQDRQAKSEAESAMRVTEALLRRKEESLARIEQERDEALDEVVETRRERDVAQAQLAALTARAEQADERERTAFMAGRFGRLAGRSGWDFTAPPPWASNADDAYAAYLAQRSDETPAQDGGTK